MPADEAPRHSLKAALEPLLPSTWRIIPYQKNIDKPDTTVVMFKQSEIRPDPKARLTHVLIDMIATIICPLTDQARAEDELDDDVLALVFALHKSRIAWTTATKVAWAAGTIAYDVSLTLSARRKEQADATD